MNDEPMLPNDAEPESPQAVPDNVATPHATTEGSAEQPAEAASSAARSEPAPPEPAPAHDAAADADVLAASRRQTRRAFVVAGAATAAGYGFYRWIDRQPGDQMQPKLLRKTLETNAALSRSLAGDRALSPTYALDRAENLRVNGVYGLKRELIPGSWRLQLVGSRAGDSHPRFVPDVTTWKYLYRTSTTAEDQGHDTKVDPKTKTSGKMAPASIQDQAAKDEDHTDTEERGTEEAGESANTLSPHTPGLLLTMEDVLQFPRHELVTQFKCIEGWSQIVHWAGVRLADLLDAYPPQWVNGREPKYVYMETPDGDYYNGYDLDACRHPQTLLVTEMMGAPLTQFHGAPLRLHMPIKYGYKQIKRIGLICYTDAKPDDYWTKLGYDWYAGL